MGPHLFILQPGAGLLDRAAGGECLTVNRFSYTEGLMARAPEIERPDKWYHVTARGNERKAIFRSDGDRNHFCELLAEHTGLNREFAGTAASKRL